ncbi:MAG: tetratricopeptide repeat protein [Bacteroidia bacterium]|nr:tetratricopeptide repeat protein [Bacteroidia bacterium]
MSLLIFVTLSCSKTRNTLISRSYHNLTAHYNAFFNGRESFKQGVKKVDNTIKDDFTTFIPVFPISNEQAAKSASSEMETALNKSAKVIKLHSITVRPKRKSGNISKKKKAFYNKSEYCNWVDDSWMLTGKSKFVNHDFYASEEAFEYIIKEYTYEEIKYDASIWLAKTYNEMGKFNDSRNILDRIEGEKDFPKRLIKELTLTYADLYIKQKKYEDAIPKLKTAITLSHKKREKARYNYILAQLYQHFQQYTNASEAYTAVTKYNPPYEMIFNAQINRATCFDFGSGNADQIRKQLSKMLKDDKNIDYQDQIYYAIANLYQKENKTELALENYKLSAKTSVSNQMQKALSFLAMADIYFGKQKYITAQAYYDSTMSFIDTKYPDYSVVDAKTKNLKELVENLLIIQNEDSLQRIAAMTEKDRNKLIDDLIQEVVKEEERKRQEEQQQQINSMLFQQNQQNQNMGTNAGGKWYFYNPATLSFGVAEFKKKWGNRKLEDDWRRKNKAVKVMAMADDTNAVDSVIKPAITDNKKREFYLQHLPLKDSLLKLSNLKVEEALFKSGEAYMNRLKNFPLAIIQFETLNSRFPNSEYKLVSYYDLYKMNVELKDNDKANKYKNLILQEFPESNFAHMLSNPNYLKELSEAKDKVNQLYDNAYQEFSNHNYFKVFGYCRVADSLYTNNHIKAKFDLLKALSTGGTGNVDGLKTSLSDIITKYPGTEEKMTAESILAFVSKGDYTYLANQTTNNNSTITNNNTITNNTTQNQNNVETNPVTQVETEDALYKLDETDKQYFIILLDKNADIYHLKYNLFGYNIDYFSMFNFEISTGTWNDRYQLIKVQPFNSRKEAVKYYKSANKHKDVVFKDIDERQYKFFVISEKNIEVLQADKDFDRYQKFFAKKYLEKGK